MNGYPHRDAGWLRRLILTLASPPLILLVPLLLFAVFRDRLPHLAYVPGATGEHGSEWGRWLRMALFPIVFAEVVFVAMFTHYQRWPELQRLLAVFGFSQSVLAAAGNGVAVAALIDADGPASQPSWAIPAEIVLAVLAGIAAWRLSGPLPPTAPAYGTPPPDVPLLSLAPGQRAVYAVSGWNRLTLFQGAVFLALAWFSAPDFAERWQATTIAALLGIFLILQARSRLRIDGRGVEVSLPWLGGLRRAVPYEAVVFASVRKKTSGRGLGGMLGGSRGWGYVGGGGPVLALRLTDGREFLYSARDAEAAAALVNGTLTRMRAGTGC